MGTVTSIQWKGKTLTLPLEAHEIETIIPQRYPMLLVDRILEVEPFKHILAIKAIAANEPHLQGHFPGFPMMPGTLILEAIGQAAAILAYISEPDRHNQGIALMSLESVKFRRPVRPGDVLTCDVSVERIRGAVWKVFGSGSVEGELAAQARYHATWIQWERSIE